MIARLNSKKTVLFKRRNCAVKRVSFLVFLRSEAGKRCCETQNSGLVSTKLALVSFN